MHSEPVHHAKGTVVLLLVEPVGDDRSVERSVKLFALSHLFKTFGKVVALAVDPSRHLNECYNLFVKLVGRKTQTIYSFDEYINSLVAPLVASACRDYYSVVGYFVACEGACDVEQTLACSLALAVRSRLQIR